jgi:hypothetical protein
MPESEKVRVRLQALDERLVRLRMEKNRLIARVSQAERKRDTRRKVLIGGAVLAAVDHEGLPAIRSGVELLRWLDARLTRPHDRAVFDPDTARNNTNRYLRPIDAERPAAERLSRMPTGGRHRQAARSVLDSRVSGGHPCVGPRVHRRQDGISFSGMSKKRSVHFDCSRLRQPETTESRDSSEMHSQSASSITTRSFSSRRCLRLL